MSRLENIKDRYMEYEYDYALESSDVNYLIEQAELAEHLKKENAELHDILAQIKYQACEHKLTFTESELEELKRRKQTLSLSYQKSDRRFEK